MRAALANHTVIENRRNWRQLLFVVVFAIAAILPVIIFGIPAGKDLQQHLQFAGAYHEAISNGDFFPGWSGAENYGFGSVGIRFYPPFPYYLLALTQVLTNNWFDSYRIDCVFWMLLGCAGVYFWAKEYFSPLEATLAAALYAIIPYHLFEIYQAGLFAEFAVSGILPFCFLFLTKIIRRGKIIDILLCAVACALLILSHIPLTMIGSMSLCIYGLCLIPREKFLKIAVKILIAVALSLSATAFYWLRLVTELNWVRHNQTEYSTGDFYFRQYLFPMIYSQGKPVWHFDAQILLVILMLVPLAVLLFLQIRRFEPNADKKIAYTAFAVTGLFSIFMMSVPGAFVWDYLPVLQKIQFPWRWLAVASLFGVFGLVVGISRLITDFQISPRILIYFALPVILGISIFDLTQNILPSVPLSREAFAVETGSFRENEGCSCWWTAWATRDAFNNKEKVFAGDRTVKIGFWKEESREFTIESGESPTVRVATFYYPYWIAKINDEPAAITRADDGSIIIKNLPKQAATVRLDFREPSFLQISLIFSMSIWLILLGGVFWNFARTNKLTEI